MHAKTPKFLYASMPMQLNADYPGDRGIIFPFILNTMTMVPGQSFYMAANEPHAYISGDILECMALSDNVVRMGLTPKFKDKDVLLSMLHYHSAEAGFCEPKRLNDHTVVYRPPLDGFSEFEIECVTVPAGDSCSLEKLPCASISLFLTGEGGEYSVADGEFSQVGASGSCYFQCSDSDLVVRAAEEEIKIYRAHINLGSA